MFDIVINEYKSSLQEVAMAAQIVNLKRTINELSEEIGNAQDANEKMADQIAEHEATIEELREKVRNAVRNVDGFKAYLRVVQYVPVEAYRVENTWEARSECRALIGEIAEKFFGGKDDEQMRSAWVKVYNRMSEVSGIDLYEEYKTQYKPTHVNSAAFLDMVHTNKAWHDLFMAVAVTMIVEGK